MCCLLSVAVFSHVMADAALSPQDPKSVKMLAMNDAGHDKAPVHSKTMEPCAYLGGCTLAVQQAVPLLPISTTTSLQPPEKEDCLPGSASGRHFRPPRSSRRV